MLPDMALKALSHGSTCRFGACGPLGGFGARGLLRLLGWCLRQPTLARGPLGGGGVSWRPRTRRLTHTHTHTHRVWREETEATVAGITEEQMNRLRREHEEELMQLKVQHAKHAIPHTSYLIPHTDPWIMGNGKQAGCSPTDAFLQSPIPVIGTDVLSALIPVLLSREGGWVGLGLGNELGG